VVVEALPIPEILRQH